MSKRKCFAIVVLLILVVGGVYVWTSLGDAGDDVLGSQPARRGEVHLLDETEVPVFTFGNLYVLGRSSWLREEFQRSRAQLAAISGLTEEILPRLHRAPFSQGSWIDRLSEDLARAREEIEGQAVETKVTFHAADVEPLTAILYILLSDIRDRAEANGEVITDAYFPPFEIDAGCVEGLPEVSKNTFILREQWKREQFGAMPTDVFYLNRLFKEGECYFAVYEAWKNCGDDSHAFVNLASGLYAAVPKEGGALVRIHSFYSGQRIPALTPSFFVLGSTKSFYKSFLETVRKHAPVWEPPEEARSWIGSLEF